MSTAGRPFTCSLRATVGFAAEATATADNSDAVIAKRISGYDLRMKTRRFHGFMEIGSFSSLDQFITLLPAAQFLRCVLEW